MLGNPNTFYLSNAEYIEEKRRISIEFSNLSETKRVSFPFVPCILIHKEFLDSASIDYLNSLKEIRIEEISNGLKVFASNFSFLKELNQSVGKKGILLPPETQFLLSKNWSFFDAFELNGEIKKNNLSEFPEIRFDFAFDSLKDNAFEILAGSKKEGTDFLNKIVLSNILTLKLTSLPVSKAKVFDFFIESICFKNNFAFNKKNPKFDSGFVEKKHFEKLKEIDFSFVWPVLFSFPFYNLGFDSVNCACCKPSELNNKNILPSSSRVLANNKIIF